jgi:rubrerythrin
MDETQGLTALEVLGVAIQSEIEAMALYERMEKDVRNAALAARLSLLQQEEEKHRSMLQDLYARRFPGIELKLPSRPLMPTLDAPSASTLSVPDLFQLAMRAEQLSADFYSREAARSSDEAGRTLLRYLSNTERGHYRLLETEYELVSRFPNYYNADDFHLGDELMHVGP